MDEQFHPSKDYDSFLNSFSINNNQLEFPTELQNTLYSEEFQNILTIPTQDINNINDINNNPLGSNYSKKEVEPPVGLLSNSPISEYYSSSDYSSSPSSPDNNLNQAAATATKQSFLLSDIEMSKRRNIVLSSLGETNRIFSAPNLNDQPGMRPRKSEFMKGPDAVLDEIADLIEYKPNEFVDPGKRKRDQGSRESQQEKHKSAEKKRRTDMNDLIERMKILLPQPSEKEAKMTKMGVLNAGVDYISKIQGLTKRLLTENRQLRHDMGVLMAMYNQGTPPQHSVYPPNLPTNISTNLTNDPINYPARQSAFTPVHSNIYSQNPPNASSTGMMTGSYPQYSESMGFAEESYLAHGGQIPNIGLSAEEYSSSPNPPDLPLRRSSGGVSSTTTTGVNKRRRQQEQTPESELQQQPSPTEGNSPNEQQRADPQASGYFPRLPSWTFPIVDGSRILFFFFAMFVMWKPFDSTLPTAGQGRTMHNQPTGLLNDLGYDLMVFFSSLVRVILVWSVGITISFIVATTGDLLMTPSKEDVEKAKETFHQGLTATRAGQIPMKTLHYFSTTLEYLHRAPSHYFVITVLRTFYQFCRFFMHRMTVGLVIERFLLKTLPGRKEEATVAVNAAFSYIRNYSCPMNLDWVYITLTAINTAEVYQLKDELRDIKLAASYINTRTNLLILVKMFVAYLEWDLDKEQKKQTPMSTGNKKISSSSQTGENTPSDAHTEDLDSPHSDPSEKAGFLLATQSVKSIVSGDFPAAKEFLRQSIEVGLKANHETQTYMLARSLGALGVVALAERRHEETLYYFRQMGRISVTHSHVLGEIWSIIGCSAAFLLLGNAEKATLPLSIFDEKHAENYLNTPEGLIYRTVRFLWFMKTEKFSEKVVNYAEDIVTNLKETGTDLIFYSMCFVIVFVDATLILLEESKKETSSIFPLAKRVSSLTSEAASFTNKACHLFPFLYHRALLCKGRFNEIEGNLPLAIEYYHKALEAAKLIKLNSEVPIIEKFLESANDHHESSDKIEN